MPVATPTPKENPCCKKIRDENDPGFGTRLVFRQGKNRFELLGRYLFLEIDGIEAKWKFDEDLQDKFCYSKKYEVESESKQVSETKPEGGQTTERQETTSLLFTGPDPGNESTRQHKLFQFMASRLNDQKVKEYQVVLSVDEKSCTWMLTLFRNGELKEFMNLPPRPPTDIFDDLKADHDLWLHGQPYTAGTWWSVKFREISEITQWCEWLKAHPNEQKSRETLRALGMWRINVRNALDDMKAKGKDLSADDRKAMDAMSEFLDGEFGECNGKETLNAFLPVWNQFNQTGAAF
jgi:hypothetical protein